MTVCNSCNEPIDRSDLLAGIWVHRQFGNLYCRSNSSQMAIPHVNSNERKAAS
jgi:hypothetical protein